MATDTAQCDTCRKQVHNNEDAIACESCAGWQHFECSGMTKGEFDIIKRKNSKLTWLCIDCKPKILKATYMEDRIAEKVKAQMEASLGGMRASLEVAITTQIQATLSTKLGQYPQRQTVITGKPSPGKGINSKNSVVPTDVTETKLVEMPLIQEVNTKNDPGRVAKAATSNCNNTDKEHNDQEEGPWERVPGRRYRRNTPILGRRDIQTGPILQAADKTAWRYIGRLKEGTTTESVKAYLIGNGVEGQIICEELPTHGKMKAFKVGIPFHYLDLTSNPSFWPSGIITRRFRFPRRNPEGVSLD